MPTLHPQPKGRGLSAVEDKTKKHKSLGGIMRLVSGISNIISGNTFSHNNVISRNNGTASKMMKFAIGAFTLLSLAQCVSAGDELFP